MGVYINMEMPKNHNHVTITIWSDGTASYALHDRGESLVDFRNVEVVPVQPHGRLIDADALKRSIYDYADAIGISNMFYFDEVIQSAFENAPTIIPAEEGET